MISEKFTIDDIHQVRYDNYERRKDMTPEEIQADIEKGARQSREIIQELKSKKDKQKLKNMI